MRLDETLDTYGLVKLVAALERFLDKPDLNTMRSLFAAPCGQSCGQFVDSQEDSACEHCPAASDRSARGQRCCCMLVPSRYTGDDEYEGATDTTLYWRYDRMSKELKREMLSKVWLALTENYLKWRERNESADSVPGPDPSSK